MKKFGLIIFAFWISSCSHLFYYPDTIDRSPRKIITPYLKESLWAGPYGKVSAWTFQKNVKGVSHRKTHLVFFHGNAQNITSHFAALYWILDEGYSYTIFDYPGYGLSEGEASQKSTTETGRFVIDEIRRQNPDDKILVFGQSLGGNIAIYTAATYPEREKICGVVVDSTFLSYKTVARRALSRSWLTWLFQPLAYVLVSDSYSAKQTIQKISPTPLLIYHGQNDPVVDYVNGTDLYEAASEPKQLIPIKSYNHLESFFGPEKEQHKRTLLKFIEKNCEI